MIRYYVWLGIGFASIAAASASLAIVGLRSSALSAMERSLSQLASTTTATISPDLVRLDAALKRTVSAVAQEAARTGETDTAAMRSPALRDTLSSELKSDSVLSGLVLTSPGGVILSASPETAAAQRDLPGPQFFEAVAHSRAEAGAVATRREIRPGADESSIFFGYRVNSQGGAAIGAAIAAIPGQAWTQKLKALPRPEQTRITIVTADGAVLSSVGPAGDEADNARAGALAITTDLPHSELKVIVSTPVAAALSGWRRQAMLVAAACVVTIGCLLLFIGALKRQSAGRQAAQDALDQQNQALVAARRDAQQHESALERAAQALAAQETLLQTTLEHIDQGIMMVDAQGRIVVSNHRVSELLDLPPEFLRGRPTFAELLDRQWRRQEFSRLELPLQQALREGGLEGMPACYERQRPNGAWIEVRTTRLTNGGIVRTFTDVTQRKASQLQIERLALVDELTELPNRVAQRRALQNAFDACGESGVALLYINLDRFRLLNDARGHDVGDDVLKVVATRLRTWSGADDVVGRVGGDEFAVVHPLPLGDDSAAVAAALLALLSKPYALGSNQVTVTASVGLAVGAKGASVARTFREAEIAMYRAKDGGRNRFCRYAEAMGADRQQEFAIEQALRAAVGTADLRLAYQPIFSMTTDKICGFEALLRWSDPQHGEVSPAHFIPIAERTGLIIPIGRDVLDWACHEAVRWPSDRSVAVNLSPAQFEARDVAGLVKSALDRSGLAPERLELEITEGMLLEDTGQVRAEMIALRELGVSLTLDDFGTGHAGLSSLSRFPFRKFKIDRSFIRNLGTSREADAIVEEMVRLAKRLRMQVVAEGVETRAQFERMREIGCDFVQGYLTGRPAPAEVARALADSLDIQLS